MSLKREPLDFQNQVSFTQGKKTSTGNSILAYSIETPWSLLCIEDAPHQTPSPKEVKLSPLYSLVNSCGILNENVGNSIVQEQLERFLTMVSSYFHGLESWSLVQCLKTNLSPLSHKFFLYFFQSIHFPHILF